MRRIINALRPALVPLAAVAVVLAGAWGLARPVKGADKPAPIPVAPIRIELPAPEPLPTPEGPTYDPAIPLSVELQAVLREACAECDVPVALALGVIEVESCFQADAVSSEGCYGLMQLNPKYFPAELSPADNLREGIAHLGRLLEQYGDVGAALTAYCVGYDAGGRVYAGAVLEAAEGWEARS